MIITIDGAAGTGKSTVAKKVADALGMAYFDTGAMYRAFAYHVLAKKIPYHDEQKVNEAIHSFQFRFEGIGVHKIYFVDQRDVTLELRTPEVSDVSSVVSQYPQVRKSLLQIQKQYASSHSAVFEGRDLGTVIFPNADYKFFLTASDEVRAKRRTDELISKGIKTTFQEVLEAIQKRDERDTSRKVAPLRCAEDALLIDTGHLAIDDVVQVILNRIRS